jgi:glycosyltransferase involved in cell wall biosynthesis
MEKLAFKYSVVIPHKNCPELLKRCVDSIPKRDDIQIIVVDDNSDEGKKPLLQERNGLEVILLNGSQAKGAGKARNVGLEHAIGEWLIFVDSDDFFHKNFWGKVDDFIEDKTVDIRYFCVDSVDSDTLKPIERPSKKRLNGLIRDYLEKKEDAEDEIRFHYNVPWGKIFRRSFIIENNIRFEEVPVANDVMFSSTAGSLAKRITVYEDIMYIVTVRTGSLVLKKDRNSLRCRFMVSVRYNKYCESIGKIKCRTKLLVYLKRVLRQFGPIELLWYIYKTIEYKQNPFKGSVK